LFGRSPALVLIESLGLLYTHLSLSENEFAYPAPAKT
jgi:hypothetical protein